MIYNKISGICNTLFFIIYFFLVVVVPGYNLRASLKGINVNDDGDEYDKKIQYN